MSAPSILEDTKEPTETEKTEEKINLSDEKILQNNADSEQPIIEKPDTIEMHVSDEKAESKTEEKKSSKDVLYVNLDESSSDSEGKIFFR